MFQPRCHHSPENDFKRLCVQPHACVLYRICDAHCLLASVGLSFASFFRVSLCPWEEWKEEDKAELAKAPLFPLYFL